MEKVLVVGAFAVLLMTTIMPMAADAADCSVVLRDMAACLPYLQTNGGGRPTSQCCVGVKQVAGMAKTSPNRRDICNCLQEQLNKYKVTDTAVANLPGKCTVSLGFKISKTINCNTL